MQPPSSNPSNSRSSAISGSSESSAKLAVTAAAESLKQGGAAILEDDTEETFYLCSRGRNARVDTVNTLIVQGRAVLCAAIDRSRAERLRLLRDNGGVQSVEARSGVSTGISSADRTATLSALAQAEEFGNELVTPGHIFPVAAADGGLLYRVGIAEGVLDLLTIAGEERVGAFIHLLNDSGERATRDEANRLAKQLGLPIITLSQLAQERMHREKIVEELSQSRLPVRGVGEFQVRCFRSIPDGAEHLVLSQGEHFDADPPPLVRVQTEHRLSDLLTGGEFFTHTRNRSALQAIAKAERGIFIYVRHPRRGLLTKTVKELGKVHPIQLREYGIGCQILKHLGASRVRGTFK